MSADFFIKQIRPVTKVLTQSFTRPADTTTYTAGDVVTNSTGTATILTFSGAARGKGLGGIIQSANLIVSTAQSLKLDVELWLFDTTVAMQNDNVAWAPTDAEMKTLLCVIPFPSGAFKVGGANCAAEVKGICDSFQCAAADNSLYGILVARNAYIPTSAEELTIRLRIIQD